MFPCTEAVQLCGVFSGLRPEDLLSAHHKAPVTKLERPYALKAARQRARTTFEGTEAVEVAAAGVMTDRITKEPLAGLGAPLATSGTSTLAGHSARPVVGGADGSARHPEAAVEANLPAVVAILFVMRGAACPVAPWHAINFPAAPATSFMTLLLTLFLALLLALLLAFLPSLRLVVRSAAGVHAGICLRGVGSRAEGNKTWAWWDGTHAGLSDGLHHGGSCMGGGRRERLEWSGYRYC